MAESLEIQMTWQFSPKACAQDPKQVISDVSVHMETVFLENAWFNGILDRQTRKELKSVIEEWTKLVKAHITAKDSAESRN